MKGLMICLAALGITECTQHNTNSKNERLKAVESGEEQSTTIQYVPVTIEHPLFKVFGIDPDEYLVFYKYRKTHDDEEQQFSLKPQSQHQFSKRQKKVTQKRSDFIDSADDMFFNGYDRRESPLLFALLPVESGLFNRDKFKKTSRNIFPYLSRAQLEGKQQSNIAYLGSGIYPLE